MKPTPERAFPQMSLRILLGILATVLSLYSASRVVAAEAVVTSSEAAAESYQDNWWRSVRQGMWTWEGVDWRVVENALERIASATGKRRYDDMFDTLIDYGPGHWIYEWSAIGDKAYHEGLEHEKNGNRNAARTSFLQSSIYYTQASYPHFRDKHARAALAKAFEMYSRAGRHFAVPMEEWTLEADGARFKAFIHFPAKQSSKPLPVILKTGGMDVLSTEFYPVSEAINAAGAAMIVYDSPGTGNNGIVDVNYDKHHVAVLQKVLKDHRFDSKRIGVWSESLAGLTAVKIALGEYRDVIAASVNSCGPVHALYALELTGGTPQQFDLHEMIDAYNRGQLSQDEIDEFNQAMLSPPLEAMLASFQSETFIDRVRADPANILDILAKSLPISLIEQDLLKKNVTNTPLLTINTHADPLVPPIESQMVTDASVQGKLMIYEEYDGHCVSRAEVPAILEWLAYHLELETLGDFVNHNRDQ
ncbi:MAG: alpha/beta hydrolase [Halieaceae bacterium]|jgi:esterase FrsA|nr:alpha/beta hydrolase [Halieaceae bacterium]